MYPILLSISFGKYPPPHTHNLLASLRTKTKPRARGTPPERGSGTSLHCRAGVGSWPLRKCPSYWLPLEEAGDQAAVGETEDASRGEAPTRSVPREVARGGGRGSRGTEATAPRDAGRAGPPSGDPRPAPGEGGARLRGKEAGAAVRDRSRLGPGRAPHTARLPLRQRDPSAAGVTSGFPSTAGCSGEGCAAREGSRPLFCGCPAVWPWGLNGRVCLASGRTCRPLSCLPCPVRPRPSRRE